MERIYEWEALGILTDPADSHTYPAGRLLAKRDGASRTLGYSRRQRTQNQPTGSQHEQHRTPSPSAALSLPRSMGWNEIGAAI